MTDKPRFYSVYADDPMYVALTRERDELRAALTAALEQNERFDKQYRDAEADAMEWAIKGDELRAEVERWRATWALWRAGIENTRDFYEKDGNEPRAKAYAAILRDFDACQN